MRDTRMNGLCEESTDGGYPRLNEHLWFRFPPMGAVSIQVLGGAWSLRKEIL